MIRLLVIAVASLASFFVFFIVLSQFIASNDVAASIAVLLGFMGTPIALLRIWPGANLSAKCPGGKGLYPECLYVVRVNETKISVQRPDGESESLFIEELQEVAVITNDSGPVGADVWWVLSGKSQGSGCTFPGGATGEQEFLQFVQKLNGFNNERFIQAMGSTSNAKFICWAAGA